MIRAGIAVFTLAVVLAVTPAMAQLRTHSASPDALLTSRPERLVVRGSVTCAEHQTVLVHARVTQGGETVASGRFENRCSGQSQSWAIPAERSGGRFAAGPARLCVAYRLDGVWWNPNAAYQSDRPEICSDVRIVLATPG
jgi:hypothetical protein